MSLPSPTSDVLYIKVTPDSRTDEYISTLPDGTIKIRLRASPTDGKVNRALIDFLKKETDSDWEITSGFTSPRKILKKKK